ncbi:hypothetical protein LCGC14_0938750 [marine sediment metagenome]|uniref:Uncharacterized protein n=1 Tax=marine sediment metagenome TaxID=412755 RepID=A0A0F9P6U7_9ZZZZ
MTMELATKLHPRGFTEMSGQMAAIVAYILEEHWTDPELAELHITSDGFVLGRQAGDVGCNAWIGSVQDLERNVATLLRVAELTPEQCQRWQELYRRRVTDWRNGGG